MMVGGGGYTIENVARLKHLSCKVEKMLSQ